jgi:translation initiation factor RLI1
LANKIKSNQAITIDQQIRLDAIVYNALSHRNAIVKLQAYIRGYLVRKNCRFKRKAGDEIDFKMRNHSREINASAKLASSRKGIQGS